MSSRPPSAYVYSPILIQSTCSSGLMPKCAIPSGPVKKRDSLAHHAWQTDWSPPTNKTAARSLEKAGSMVGAFGYHQNGVLSHSSKVFGGVVTVSRTKSFQAFATLDHVLEPMEALCSGSKNHCMDSLICPLPWLVVGQLESEQFLEVGGPRVTLFCRAETIPLSQAEKSCWARRSPRAPPISGGLRQLTRSLEAELKVLRVSTACRTPDSSPRKVNEVSSAYWARVWGPAAPGSSIPLIRPVATTCYMHWFRISPTTRTR